MAESERRKYGQHDFVHLKQKEKFNFIERRGKLLSETSCRLGKHKPANQEQHPNKVGGQPSVPSLWPSAPLSPRFLLTGLLSRTGKMLSHFSGDVRAQGRQNKYDFS